MVKMCHVRTDNFTFSLPSTHTNESKANKAGLSQGREVEEKKSKEFTMTKECVDILSSSLFADSSEGFLMTLRLPPEPTDDSFLSHFNASVIEASCNDFQRSSRARESFKCAQAPYITRSGDDDDANNRHADEIDFLHRAWSQTFRFCFSSFFAKKKILLN